MPAGGSASASGSNMACEVCCWPVDPRNNDSPSCLPRSWNAKTGELLRSDYFVRRPHPAANDRPAELNFLQDYWVPSWQKWNARIRQTQPNAISFVNPPVFEEPPELSEVDQGGRCCLTPHFYDVRLQGCGDHVKSLPTLTFHLPSSPLRDSRCCQWLASGSQPLPTNPSPSRRCRSSVTSDCISSTATPSE